MVERFNVFKVPMTEVEQEELSKFLDNFFVDYENEFHDYFGGEKNEEVADFMYFYKGLYDLVSDLIYRDVHTEE